MNLKLGIRHRGGIRSVQGHVSARLVPRLQDTYVCALDICNGGIHGYYMSKKQLNPAGRT